MILFNDTGKNSALFSIQYKNGWLATSDLFYMFTQSIKFYTFYYQILRVQMFEKRDPSNRQKKWMVARSSKFYAKFGLVFLLTLENAFF